MSEIKRGVIRFLGYRIVKVNYDCSPDFEFEEGTLRFNFQKCLIPVDEKSIQINLSTNVFFAINEKDDEFDKSPYRFSIEIAGRFDSEEKWQDGWETNALAILFPYIRAIVSSISAQSGRDPIILPTINIAQMFNKNESTESSP